MTTPVHECLTNPLPAPVAPTLETSEQFWSDGELEISVSGTSSDVSRTVSIQVVDPSYWLLHCWFIDGDTVTEYESLTPPSTPGVSNFKKVTDATGLVEFDIENDPPWQGRLCAVLVGRVNVSDVVVVGV